MAYEMNQLLEAMIENGASDLHIRVGRSPSLRVNGEMISIDGPALTEAETKTMVMAIVPPGQNARLAADGGCARAPTCKVHGTVPKDCNARRSNSTADA